MPKIRTMATTRSLYKDALRAIKGFPFEPLRQKTKSNLKLLYQVYKNEQSPEKLLEGGQRAVKVIKALTSDPRASANIFKPFESVAPKK